MTVRRALPSLVAAVALTLSGCSSDDPAPAVLGSTGPGSTGAASPGPASSVLASSDPASTSAPTPSDEPPVSNLETMPSIVPDASAAPSTAESATTGSGTSSGSDLSSGSAATSSTPGGSVPRLVDEADAEEATMTLTDGTFAPATITVPAGSTVTFAIGDADLHGLVVGQQNSITGSRNVPNVFFFKDPGSYDISDEMSGATATVVVE